MIEWKCKTCKNHIGCLCGDKVFIYCNVRHNYPSSSFIKAWGCDDYEKESEHLSLFDEERRKDK